MLKFLLSIFFPKHLDGTLNQTPDKNVSSYVDANDRNILTGYPVRLAMFPFTFDKLTPLMTQKGNLLEWEFVDKVNDKYVGAGVLKNAKGEILLAVNDSTYLQGIAESPYFILFKKVDKNGDDCFELTILNVEELLPFPDGENQLLKFEEQSLLTGIYNSPVLKHRVKIIPGSLKFEHQFPDVLKQMDEILMVQYVSWLQTGPCTCIVSLRPKDGLVILYPQDWFNKSEADFGYQWITMAKRNPHSQLIEGTGIRIGSFVLDKTGRQKLKG